jgi:hypothetical protein
MDFKNGNIDMFIGAVYGDGRPTGQLNDETLKSVGLSLEQLSQTIHRGISGSMVSEYITITRRYLRARFKQLYRTGKSERHSHYPVKLPVMPQYRKLYAIEGRKVMRNNQHGCPAEDSVGLIADWRKPGYVWEVPYASLYPDNITGGILFAGRCMAAVGDAWEVIRVIPAASMTGQVAGLAASLAVDRAEEPYQLNVGILQSELVKLGFPLHLQDVGL